MVCGFGRYDDGALAYLVLAAGQGPEDAVEEAGEASGLDQVEELAVEPDAEENWVGEDYGGG